MENEQPPFNGEREKIRQEIAQVPSQPTKGDNQGRGAKQTPKPNGGVDGGTKSSDTKKPRKNGAFQ
ncbi:hypothetical protein [Pseudomonas libanensis]|uniref:hypothetical protein n=1 Tax=Pseudomonas libanensis TaxID=75588 RepID=UPI0012E35B23|nr:hypothetical protein [Pseudomonas libanensis]